MRPPAIDDAERSVASSIRPEQTHESIEAAITTYDARVARAEAISAANLKELKRLHDQRIAEEAQALANLKPRPDIAAIRAAFKRKEVEEEDMRQRRARRPRGHAPTRGALLARAKDSER